MPQRLRQQRRSVWSDRHLGGIELDAFLEGPVFDRQGNLFMVDIPFGRILCLDRSGDWSVVAVYDGWPNGMRMLDDKTFMIADQKRGLVELQRDSGQMRVVCSGIDGEPFHGLNDLLIAGNGDIFITDQGLSDLERPYGRLLCLRQDGSMETVLGGIPSPNGLVLSADERTLYLAVTRGNAIWRVPFAADGSARKAGLFIQLSGGIGPDGLVRPRGGEDLIVAHPGLGLWHFSASGLPRFFWQREGYDYCTNLAENPVTPGQFWITESKTATVLRTVSK